MSIEFHRDGPWELPGGWVWARLGDVSQINQSPSFDELPADLEIPFVPMAAVAEETGIVDLSQRRRVSELRNGYTRFRSGDVLFAKITPCMENGKSVVLPDIPSGYGAGSTEFHTLRSQAFDARYLWYWLVRKAFRADAQRNMRGAVGQLRVPLDYLQDVQIAIPPLAEQRRIVACIDELFTEIADGEASLARARDDLDTWRRAMLKAAVTGKLTCEWRVRNNPAQTAVEYVANLSLSLPTKRSRRTPSDILVEAFGQDISDDLPDTWTQAEIGKIFEVATGATPKRDERRYYDGGRIPWVTSSVVNYPIVLKADQFITNAAIEETNAKIFPPGTILVAMYGEGKTRGKATELAIAAATNQACAALLQPGNETELKSYVKYWFEYNYLELRKQAAGGVQPNLNLEMIKRLRLPIPPREEMLEVVATLAADFDSFAATSYEMDTLNKSISGLRQSVLKTAFEGRLVEQDPRDEPADKLLARLNDRVIAPSQRSSTRQKRRVTLAAE